MGRRGLAAGAIALGVASLLAAAGRFAHAPFEAAREIAGPFGPGAPEPLPAAPLPVLRFAVPAGGHASLRLGLLAGDSGERVVAADVALVALLGVPGEWPLDGALELADPVPTPETEAAPVPEPGSLALLCLGAAGLAGARAVGPRGLAGRGSGRLSP
jgi:hypothetical protein